MGQPHQRNTYINKFQYKKNQKPKCPITVYVKLLFAGCTERHHDQTEVTPLGHTNARSPYTLGSPFTMVQ